MFPWIFEYEWYDTRWLALLLSDATITYLYAITIWCITWRYTSMILQLGLCNLSTEGWIDRRTKLQLRLRFKSRCSNLLGFANFLIFMINPNLDASCMQDKFKEDSLITICQKLSYYSAFLLLMASFWQLASFVSTVCCLVRTCAVNCRTCVVVRVDCLLSGLFRNNFLWVVLFCFWFI